MFNYNKKKLGVKSNFYTKSALEICTVKAEITKNCSCGFFLVKIQFIWLLHFNGNCSLCQTTKAPTLSSRKLLNNSKLWSSRSRQLRQTWSHCLPTVLLLHCLFNSVLPITNKTALLILLISTTKSKSTTCLLNTEVILYLYLAIDEKPEGWYFAKPRLELNVYFRIEFIFSVNAQANCEPHLLLCFHHVKPSCKAGRGGRCM